MALHGNIMATAWQPHGKMHGRVHDKRMATAWQLHGNIIISDALFPTPYVRRPMSDALFPTPYF